MEKEKLQTTTKPWSKKRLFIEVSSQELTEFLAFRDALRLIKTEEAEAILIPDSQLVRHFLKYPKHSCLGIHQTIRYGDTYYQFTQQSLYKLADWVI